MIPGLTAADLDPDIDATIAITRALPSRESVAELPSASDEPSVFSDVSQRLAPGTELFNRARIVKQEMVTEGLIAGDRELEGMDASAPAEDAIDTRHLPETDHPLVDAGAHDSYLDDESDDYDDIISSTGSTRDTTTLRAALEVTPNDDELRWWLAEALRERGDMEQSYAEYRWIIRHAPERHDAVLHSLQSCVERDQEPEMAHRLIGDIYRRRGDVARASNHAALALQVRRRATAAVRAR
jgi:tetratricopeptide (TPR) repeat protein